MTPSDCNKRPQKVCPYRIFVVYQVFGIMCARDIMIPCHNDANLLQQYYCSYGVEMAASKSGTGGGGVLASSMAMVGRPWTCRRPPSRLLHCREHVGFHRPGRCWLQHKEERSREVGGGSVCCTFLVWRLRPYCWPGLRFAADDDDVLLEP